MSEGYHVLALVPKVSPFTLEAAVRHFATVRYRTFAVRSELALSPSASSVDGFRATYQAGWSITAWLESGERVASENAELADTPGLPAPRETVLSCDRRLSIWSDEDPDLANARFFEDFIADLRERFGALIRDPATGAWRV